MGEEWEEEEEWGKEVGDWEGRVEDREEEEGGGGRVSGGED